MSEIWLLLFLIGITTYLIRLSFIFLFGKFDVPLWLRRTLKYIPPAVLSAIIFPDLFIHSGAIEISLTNPRLVAGIIAAVIAWKTKNILLTISIGMISLWIMQYLIALL